MHSTNALRRNNDESETEPKVNKKLEMETHIKTNLGRKDLYKGNGLLPSVPAIILPCDPIALVERLDIQISSKEARNTGVRNELVSTCDELLR